MPSFDIIREVSPKKTFRVASVIGTFDLQSENVREHFVGNIDLPTDWRIGLIVGNSGTGKTTIARELFNAEYVVGYEYNAESILDDMPKSCSVEEITKAFCSVGFASTPSWIKPYSVLSNGEKMRVDIARTLLERKELSVFDEFTSVVDRNVAKIASFAIQKAIRRDEGGGKFIAVSCHCDIEDWLLPDWVFDTNTMTFRLCEGQKKNRPKLELKFYETKSKDYYWAMFRKHHYLNHDINKASRCFVATLNGEICAFNSVLPFPHPIVKNVWREHRLVVLPDYQGIGLGMKISNITGNILKKGGKDYISTTSNPKLIHARSMSSMWKITRFGRVHGGTRTSVIKKTSSNRITASFKYIG